jgi:hypothetical protein
MNVAFSQLSVMSNSSEPVSRLPHTLPANKRQFH